MPDRRIPLRCCFALVLLAGCTPSARLSDGASRDERSNRTEPKSPKEATEPTGPRSTETTNPPHSSTEVGNPPIVNGMKYFGWSTSMNGEYVVISGEPGAVEPGGSTIEITNLSTGETTTVTSNEDGSFRAEVPGSFADGFRLRASDGEKKSEPVTFTPDEINTAMDGGVDAGEPSDAGADASEPTEQQAKLSPAECRAVTMTAAAMVERSTPAVDRSCSVAEDCVFLREALSTSCSKSCSTQVGSVAGSLDIKDLVEAIARGACDEFEASGCKLEDPMCPPETRALMCVDGLCVAGDPAKPVSCETMTAEADARLTTFLESEINTCRTDSDCVWGSFTPDCFERCVAVPLQVIGGDIFDAFAPIDEACADFARLGCERTGQGCTGNEPDPVCQNGRCVAR